MELLVVISIMVLVAAMALPMFNFMSGSRSTDAAANVTSATLGRARAQALGLQSNIGVAFYVDPKTKRTALAIVGPDITQSSANWIDTMPSYDLELLPKGIGAQFVYNCTFSGGARTSDGYIRQPGLILFDGYGQLVSYPYRIRAASKLGQLMGLSSDFDATTAPIPAASQFGIVFYDTTYFTDAGYNDEVMFLTSPYDPAKDTWLDRHGAPFLVNRYNGTLMKAEASK